MLGYQRGGIGRVAGHVDRGGGRVRGDLAADNRVRSRQPDAAVQLDRQPGVQGDRQPAAGDHVVQGRFAAVDGNSQDQRDGDRDPADFQ